jgi:hypothetical protein
MPAVIDLILDDCELEWVAHFDPHLDIIFGKGGLSNDLWYGQKIFDSIDTCPQYVKDVCTQHKNDV